MPASHYVNPVTGKVLGEESQWGASAGGVVGMGPAKWAGADPRVLGRGW
jgi:hypothetical protein